MNQRMLAERRQLSSIHDIQFKNSIVDYNVVTNERKRGITESSVGGGGGGGSFFYLQK